MRKLFTVLATAIVLLAGSALMRASSANGRLGRSVADHQGRFARRNGRLLVRPLSLRLPPVLWAALGLLRLAPSLSLALLAGTQSRCGTTGGRWSLHDRDREPTQRYAFWNWWSQAGQYPTEE